MASGMRLFYVLWGGQSLSCLGSYLTSFCLKVWILQRSPSLTVSALTTVFTELPSILLSPLAGLAADKLSRRRVMLWSDTAAFVVSMAVALLAWHDALQIWHIYFGNALQSCCKALQWPAFEASVAALVPRERLDRANGLMELSDGLIQLLVPALAGLLLLQIGLRFVLLFDFLSFFAGILPLLLFVRDIPAPAISDEGRRLAAAAAGSLWKEAVFLVGLLRREHAPLLAVLLLSCTENLSTAYLSELIPPLVLRLTDVEGLGYVISFAGIGALVGSLIVATVGTPRRRAAMLAAGLAWQGLLMFNAAGQASVWLIGFGIMLADPFASAASAYLWQTTIPQDLQGRVFGLTRVIALSSVPVGALTAGPLVDFVCEPLMAHGGPLSSSLGLLIGTGPGRGTSLLFIVLGGLLLAISAYAYFWTDLRSLDLVPAPSAAQPGPTLAEKKNS